MEFIHWFDKNILSDDIGKEMRRETLLENNKYENDFYDRISKLYNEAGEKYKWRDLAESLILYVSYNVMIKYDFVDKKDDPENFNLENNLQIKNIWLNDNENIKINNFFDGLKKVPRFKKIINELDAIYERKIWNIPNDYINSFFWYLFKLK